MKFLDLDELLDANKKIYVKNNALKSRLLLVLELKDKNGRSRSLKIPPMDVPICISDQYSKDMIRDSSDLRHNLMRQTLVLVDPEVAEKILSTQDAKEQLKAFNLSVYSDTAPTNALRDSMERLNNQSQQPQVVSSAQLLKQPVADDPVSLRIKGMIASFQSKEKSSKDTLVALRRVKSTLTEPDLTYIISQCKEETTIREFAEKALTDLASAPAPEQEPV